MQNSLLGSLF